MESKKRQATGESLIKCMNIYNTSFFFRKICAIAELQAPQCGFCHEQSLLKVPYLPFLIISQSIRWITHVPESEFLSSNDFCSVKQNVWLAASVEN